MWWLILYFVLFVIFAPLFLVAIGLPFKKHLGLRDFADGSVIDLYDLPDWLWFLQNPKDGLTGDGRGWFWNIKAAGWPAWLKMLWWSGWRNPWKYLKDRVFGINVRHYVMTKIIGQDHVRDDFRSTGFHILKATPKSGGFNKYTVYYVRRWGESKLALVFQLGQKIKLSHNDVTDDKWVGVTLELNPFKDIS